MAEKINEKMTYLSIVGIVAIVGMVAILVAFNNSKTASSSTNLDPNIFGVENQAGLAYVQYPLNTSTGSTRVFQNVTDLVGNGVLHYNNWGSNYYYADGFCKLVKGCEGYVNVSTVQDGMYSCRCDSRWGCSGNSCTSARYSWSRFDTVVCTGCPVESPVNLYYFNCTDMRINISLDNNAIIMTPNTNSSIAVIGGNTDYQQAIIRVTSQYGTSTKTLEAGDEKTMAGTTFFVEHVYVSSSNVHVALKVIDIEDSGCRMNTSTRVFQNVTDLVGNGVLHYNNWGSNYYYADGFCKLVKGCEGYVNVSTVQDGMYSCRCDSRWGCSGNSCTSARYSWSRFDTVVCTGCPS